MIRTVIIPDTAIVNVSFSIPDEYIGEEMEVIAFTKKEGLEETELPKKKISFKVLHVDNKDYKFNRDEANGR